MKEKSKMQLFPPTGWQDYLLAFASHGGAHTDFVKMMTLNAAFLVKPKLNERRLVRAFDALCKRLDIALTQFKKLGGKWKCAIN